MALEREPAEQRAGQCHSTLIDGPLATPSKTGAMCARTNLTDRFTVAYEWLDDPAVGVYAPGQQVFQIAPQHL